MWGIFLLGREAFGPAAGVLAAFVVATRDPFLSQAVRAYVDIPFLALVVAAAVLEMRRPRAGLPVLVLLGLGGTAAAGGLAVGRRVLAICEPRAARPSGPSDSPPWPRRRRCCGRSATWPSRAIRFTR